VHVNHVPCGISVLLKVLPERGVDVRGNSVYAKRLRWNSCLFGAHGPVFTPYGSMATHPLT